MTLDTLHPQRLPEGSPLVRFADVTKRYGSLTVLDQLNLDIAQNEMVSIIGPSGSGKTTVLRVLMTLEGINDGVIYVDDEPLTHMPKGSGLIQANEKYLHELRSKIGMVFQERSAPLPTVRRSATARGHRPRAGNAPQGDAAGRGDIGT